MQRILLTVTVLLLLLLAVMWAFNATFRDRADALGDVGKTLVSADCNQVPVVRCGAELFKAEHNIDIVTRAADYLVAVGGNTSVFLEIARIAAEADDECPRLNDVLDLAVMKQSESMRVLALAGSACSLRTQEQVAAWNREYEYLAASAEYASVEEGLARRTRE